MSDFDIVRKAQQFAAKAHEGQKRKYTEEPYVYHPMRVAFWVATALGDPEVTAAALLHDVVEDTAVTLDDIETQFGSRVAGLVEEVTDVSNQSDGNRRVRKAIDRDHLTQASPEGQSIKLADLIDNAESISQHDPGFAKVYMREKEELLEVLTRGNEDLYRHAEEMLTAYFDGEKR